MADLTADTPRAYALTPAPLWASVPVKASTCLYEGMAVGEDSSNGTADVFADGDTFLGFAERKADNSSGSAGDIDVKLRTKGIVELTVTGVDNVNDLGATVYATDSNTFSLTDSGSDTAIGRVHQVISTSSNKALVYFEGASARSI